ncbi:MAG: dipeptide epimerase [Bryobacterales bacterium]|jgi:L-alanine-DL-glutamate epimerase-like enolase superfamily enzyme|nr:dipeptide epimerase [Bryobacterales bacterium]
MTRRTLITRVAAVPGSAAFPVAVALPAGAMAQSRSSRAKVTTRVRRLELKHTWTTVMSSSTHRDTFFVEFQKDGITGVGEGAPIVRYNESAASAKAAIDAIAPYLESCDPGQFAKVKREVFTRVPGEWAAKAAVDIAILDWAAQKLGTPLHRLFGLDAEDAPVTTFSIGIDKPEVVRRKVAEAKDYPLLKVKVGLDNDQEILAAVRAETNKPLICDANEGFRSKEQAVEKIQWLAGLGVTLIEQPLPASNLADMNWIRERVSIPVIADEACLRPEDVPRLAPYFDGVNVKVDKCGGLQEALRMIHMARALGLKVMIGCMVSSSVAITAAAQLSPLVDYADLDGNLLIANDPYTGVVVRAGKLLLPLRPGLGLSPALSA